MMLIDAHGPGHGLSVEVDITYSHNVTIRQWGECSEPDEHGSYTPHIQEATIALRDLLDRNGKHYRSANLWGEQSQHGKIVALALAWLGYWGGSEDHVSDDDRPCDHFAMNYSGIGAPRVEPYPEHMTCVLCHGKPE